MTAITAAVLRWQIEDQPAVGDGAIDTPTQTAGSPVDMDAFRVDAERPTGLADDKAKAIGEIMTNTEPLGGMVETNPTKTNSIGEIMTNAEPLGGMVETNPTKTNSVGKTMAATNSGKTTNSNSMTDTNSGKTTNSNSMTDTNSGKTTNSNSMTDTNSGKTTNSNSNSMTDTNSGKTSNSNSNSMTATTIAPAATEPATQPTQPTQPAEPARQPVAAPRSPLHCLLMFLLRMPC